MVTSEENISASQFKARCLQLIEHAYRDNTSIVITKRGIPLARLVPYNHAVPSLFGAMQGSVTINGDIIAPIYDVWDADA